MKLTVAVRETITTEMLKHRFAAEVLRYIADRAQLADDVYCDIYRKADRERMESLPAGWLPDGPALSIQFGDSGSYYETLCFDGDISGPLRRLVRDPYKKHDEVTKRILCKHRHGCAKVYPADHKLSLRYRALKATGNDLQSRVSAAGKQAEAALNSVTTMAALIKAWPEVEPFTKRYFAAPVKLPSIPISALNETFKLPVKKAA